MSELQRGLSAPQIPPARRHSTPPPLYQHPIPDTAPRQQQEERAVTRGHPQTETAQPCELPLPPPGPPPKGLVCSSICPASRTSSSGGGSSKDFPSVQESFVPCNFVAEGSRQLVWPLRELCQGTSNFSQSLLVGEGGFGCVYKATMRNTEYAVKRLKQDSELEWSTIKNSFLTEIKKLTWLRHPNIIDLAGYCMEGEECCLIYLYLPNGSLEDQLHSQGSFSPLSWQQRVVILQGAACGIQFLHTCQPSVIHGDIKSSNILLDQALTPKLGDFGLARFSRYTSCAGRSRSVGQTSTVRGTLAYLPDEYVKLGKLTLELDTYSFGVVLLENLTGRKAIQSEGKSYTKYLKDLVKEEECNEEAENGSVPGASGAGVRIGKEAKLARLASRICRQHLDCRVGHCPQEVAHELCLLACRCLERQKNRPSMVEVFKTLKRLQDLLHCPTPDKGLGICVSHSSAGGQRDPLPPLQDLMSSLQDALLTPEENTYKFTPCRTGCGIPMLLPVKGSGSVRPYDPSLSQYEAKLDSFGSITSSWGSPRTFQGGQNVPVESDDSVPDSCLSAISQELRDLSILRPGSKQGGSTSPGAALQCQNQMPGAQGQLPPQHSLLGQSSLAGDGNSASADSQVMFVPRHQIVINPAKQKFVEQLALYDQGQITSLELLSSGTSPGHHCEARGDPEESDDFLS
ncbi:interleukin-1 receptor-associated kinase 1 isoform X3 [Ascaphus truei]